MFLSKYVDFDLGLTLVRLLQPLQNVDFLFSPIQDFLPGPKTSNLERKDIYSTGKKRFSDYFLSMALFSRGAKRQGKIMSLKGNNLKSLFYCRICMFLLKLSHHNRTGPCQSTHLVNKCNISDTLHLWPPISPQPLFFGYIWKNKRMCKIEW